MKTLKRMNEESNKCLVENTPLISVIIPIYNMGRYLRPCLDSVVHQSLRNIEIICVNDGSTDDTKEILKEYAWKDKRIKILEQSNHGVAFARNRAIGLATGHFLYFIDPDDWIPDSNVLHDLYHAAILNKALICGGSFREENEHHGTMTKWTGENKKYTFDEEGFVEYKDYQFDFGWVRFIYNREFIIHNKLNIPSRKYYEDPVFFVHTMSKAERFYALL